jgi:hypothetical protein
MRRQPRQLLAWYGGEHSMLRQSVDENRVHYCSLLKKRGGL